MTGPFDDLGTKPPGDIGDERPGPFDTKPGRPPEFVPEFESRPPQGLGPLARPFDTEPDSRREFMPDLGPDEEPVPGPSGTEPDGIGLDSVGGPFDIEPDDLGSGGGPGPTPGPFVTQPDDKVGDEIYRMTQEKLREAVQKLDEFASVLQAVAEAAAVVLGAWVHTKIQEFEQWKLRTLVEIGKLTIDLVGNPSGIRKVGDDWTQQVGAPAITQAQSLGREQLPSYGRWKGSAADVYYIGVGLGQIKALEAVRNATNEINESMKAIAAAVTSFWTSVGVAVATLVGGIVGALAASGTIVGIPAGLVIGVGACITFGALMADAIFGLGNALNDTRLLTAAENATPLQAGWPRLASPDVVGDGSANDGDPSDWQLSTG